MKNINKLILVFLLATFGLVACDSGNNPESSSPEQQMEPGTSSEEMAYPEEQSDSMGESTEENMDDAMDEGKQAMDEMGQTMEGAASEAEDTMEEMGQSE